MQYDVIIIGAGLSGLSAASLLAKRGLKTAVIEHNADPGGSCGIFKRNGVIFDQGAAMLYGFGEHGFNAHRFLFNCLEEPFEVVKHELLYTVHFKGHRIRFWSDLDLFIEELSDVFPGQAGNIRRFYKDMQQCYLHVISETPNYTTPDETDPKSSLQSVLRHPISYIRFLSYLNISAEKLLRKYFTDPDILHFFDKLTSTYCYATLKEAPAILASVMFIDNHEGGSFYPAGSTLFLPGKLEKVIEENNGDMYYNSTVTKILFDHENASGVRLEDGAEFYGKNIIYSGTVWNLYGKLLSEQTLTEKEKKWAAQIPTYPSVVLYALVNSCVIPRNTCPIEMLAANPDTIDESEITVYILSLDDHTLCQKNQQVVIAIGPSFRDWDTALNSDSTTDDTPPSNNLYAKWKKEETDRILFTLEKRFPGFQANLLHCELATPKTIEHYTMKNNGSAAGPKQMLGQHMLLRQPIRTRWENLFVCGDSTTMGTGTPTVTTSGIAAANAILNKLGLEPYVWKPDIKNYVKVLYPPIERDWLHNYYPEKEASIMAQAAKCYYCQNPACCQKEKLNIPGIMRRLTCGNFYGAVKEMQKYTKTLDNTILENFENNCIQNTAANSPVPIREILSYLMH